MVAPERKEKLRKQLVNEAKSVVYYEHALPYGVFRIKKILYSMELQQYPVFEKYYSACSGLPVGSERRHWDRKSLDTYDKKIIKLNAKLQPEIFAACYKIIDTYQ
ncbi:MAG: DUF2489 domain-containing protein [Alphaproteobacteria bacterium]|nr:DUF2489 domain-containing protein [Alphaproteobacteria bacterium]